MAKPGPKPKLSDEKVQAQIFAIVGLGQSLQTAADFVGVDRRTLMRYRSRSKQFAQGLLQAKSRGKIALLQKINTASDWRAQAWLLERTHYQEFGRKDAPPERTRAKDLLTTDPALASASAPPGAIPALPQPGEIQDSSSGPPVGQDGTGEAQAGDDAVGLPDSSETLG